MPEILPILRCSFSARAADAPPRTTHAKKIRLCSEVMAGGNFHHSNGMFLLVPPLCYFFAIIHHTESDPFISNTTCQLRAYKYIHPTLGKLCQVNAGVEEFLPMSSLLFFVFWASCWNHCLAALDLRAGVEQPFYCLIVQNRQVMQSMGRSLDWTLEDNMVDSLFFCATLTGRRGGHAPFVQAGAETPDTGAEAVKPDPGSSWEGHSGWMGAGVRMKCGVLWGCPFTPHSTSNPPIAPHVCCC